MLGVGVGTSPMLVHWGGSSSSPTIITYGRTAGYNAGTTADYYVDDVNGNDSNPGTFAAPFATIQAAFTASAGGGKVIAIRDSGQTYREAVTSSLSNMTVKGYGAEQPKWYGSYLVTGWAQCTSGDQSVVGSNYASIYKATVSTSNLPPTIVSAGAYSALMPLENGSPLNLCQLRHDTSDLFFQDNTDAFYRSDKGDSVTLTPSAVAKTQTLIKGVTDGTDTIDSLGGINSIIAVNQGGTWNGSSFTGGTTYTATTDYTLSSTTGISWAPAGSEPTQGTSYQVAYTQGVGTITHAAVLGNGTTPYTDAQLARCAVMAWCQSNLSKFLRVTGSSGGVLTVEANTYLKQGTADAYALLNILPAMSQGQFGYVDNGDGTITLYVWPNNAAHLSSGIAVIGRNNVLTFSQCSNVTVKNIEFGHCADATTGVASVVFDRVTNGTFIQNTIQYYSHKEKGYGAIFVVGGSSVTVQNCDLKNGQNSFGPFFNGSPYTATGHRLLNCYMYRIAQSPWRMYQQLMCAVVDNKSQNCGLSAHANKGNFYAGCDRYVALRNWWINCGGYLTMQEASRGLFLMNLCPADPGGADARAFDDQTGSVQPPTDPSNNHIFNNAFPVPGGNTGTGQSVNLVFDQGSWQVNWKFLNNVCRSIITDAGHLVSTPDYNIYTSGSAVGAHDSVVTDTNLLYYDNTSDNWNTVPGSVLTSKTGTDVSADIATYEGWFPDINFRTTLNGYAWDPADPGVGPYGKHWPVQVDTTAPILSSLSATITGSSASCTVTTNEKGGTLYWVRYHGGSVPSGAQVVAGQDGTGSAALSSGSFTVGAAGSLGPFTVTGTAGVTDTLAVAHKDRNGNISTVLTTSLAFAAYSPSWWSNDGTHKLHTAGLTGAQATTKSVLAAFTVSRSSGQLTTATSGGVLIGSGTSTNIPTWGMATTSKMQISQKSSANVTLGTITSPSVVMTANTQYLFLLSYTSSGGGGYFFTVVCVNVATGATVGTTQQLTGADTSLTFNMALDALKAAATYERIMLWDNVYADPTQAATQQLFVANGGGLLDPNVAVSSLGTPIVNVYGNGLTTGSNAGSGGNFTWS